MFEYWMFFSFLTTVPSESLAAVIDNSFSYYCNMRMIDFKFDNTICCASNFTFAGVISKGELVAVYLEKLERWDNDENKKVLQDDKQRWTAQLIKNYRIMLTQVFSNRNVQNVDCQSVKKTDKLDKGFAFENTPKDCPFEFRDFHFSHKAITAKEKQFAIGFGFNRELLGCPAYLCIEGNVDAAAHTGSHVFVANKYSFWLIPDSKEVYELQSPNGSLKVENTDIASVDAAFAIDGFIHVIAYGKFYILEKAGILKSIPGKNAPFTTVAAYYYSDTLYVFAEINGQTVLSHTKFSKQNENTGTIATTDATTGSTSEQGGERRKRQDPPSNETIEESVKEGEGLPSGYLEDKTYSGEGVVTIDAAFFKNGINNTDKKDRLYVFKGWKYATVILEEGKTPDLPPEDKWRYSMLEVFSCDSQNYQKNGIYGEYIGTANFQEFLHKFVLEKELTNTKLIPLILLGIFAFIQVVAIIAAFYFWYKYKKETEQGLISMMNTYRKRGKQGNEDRLSKVMSSHVGGSRIDAPSSQIGASNRSRLSALDSVGQSKVDLGATPKRKRK